MTTLQIQPIRMFREFNSDGTKVHLKQLLKVGHKGLIPNNVILNKTLPGLGATTCEIESERHSIIIEPNVPVIDGKVAKYPHDERWPYKVLGVRKGVKISTIMAYLNNKSIPYKKILTTPESYIYKVIPALLNLEMTDYRSEYFLLLDESEKFIQDTDFRESLFMVMKDFWKFDNKALVSATPIIPSDKAYQEQGFKVVQVQPKFDYSKEVTTIFTNSVLDSVKAVYNEELKTDKTCFFVNSITMIDNIIRHLNIKDETRIFCGEDSIPKLKDLGYEDYSPIINNIGDFADLKHFNFFTSRFFSAVDIDLTDDNVSVIMVTDVYVAPHSALDPHTHVKQIIGRFRNNTQYNCHIYNTRDDVEYRSKEEVLNFTRGSYSAFKAVHTLYRNESEPMIKKALKAALYQLKFKDYLYPYNGTLAINWLLIDNEIEDEKVKSLYSRPSNLQIAYGHDAFYSTFTRRRIFAKDVDKLRYQISKMNLKTLRANMVDISYQMLHGELDGPITEHFSEYELQKEGGYILGVAQYMEREDLENYNYNPKVLDGILNVLLKRDITENYEFRKAIRKKFIKGTKYSRAAISDRLEKLFDEFGVNGTFKATRLQDYCSLSPLDNIGVNDVKLPDEIRPKGYRVLDHLLSISD
jgi:hypothetical protein